MLLLGERPHRANRVRRDFAEVDLAWHHDRIAGFGAREQEKVIDDPLQPIALAAYALERVAQLRRWTACRATAQAPLRR